MTLQDNNSQYLLIVFYYPHVFSIADVMASFHVCVCVDALQRRKFLRMKRQKYGYVYRTHLFGNPTVRVTGADNVRHVLLGEHKLVSVQWPASVRTILGSDTLSSVHGAQHKTKKKVSSRLFSFFKLTFKCPDDPSHRDCVSEKASLCFTHFHVKDGANEILLSPSSDTQSTLWHPPSHLPLPLFFPGHHAGLLQGGTGALHPHNPGGGAGCGEGVARQGLLCAGLPGDEAAHVPHRHEDPAGLRARADQNR